MYKTAKETQIKRIDFWTLGEGEGGVIWENSIETYILSYVNGLPVQVRCMRQGAQGWYTVLTLRDGMGRGVQDGEHMYTHGWFTSMYGKNHHNIVK